MVGRRVDVWECTHVVAVVIVETKGGAVTTRCEGGERRKDTKAHCAKHVKRARNDNVPAPRRPKHEDARKKAKKQFEGPPRVARTGHEVTIGKRKGGVVFCVGPVSARVGAS